METKDKTATKVVGKNKRKEKTRRQPKTIMKGVYFEPAVYEALLDMQDRGQNVSKFINRIVRQFLTI